MAALAPVSQTLRVDVSGAAAGGMPWDTRFFIHYAGTAPTNADLNAYCLAVGNAYNTSLLGLTAGSVLLKQVKAVDLTSSTAAVGQDGTNHIGSRAGATLPPSNCVVVSYEVAVRYRGGHPRGYWPFGVAADVSGVDWSAGLVNAVQTGIQSFFTAVKAAGWTGSSSLRHDAVSYYYTPLPKPPEPPFTVPRPVPVSYPVTSYVARTSIGTQRRRLHYNG